MDDYYLIGKIVSVYKNNGFVKVLSYSDFPGRFHNLKKVFMDFFDDMKEFQIENIKELTVPDIIYIKFRNFNTAGEAANLVGRSIFVDKNDLVKLPENVFFIHDLIGSRVFRKGELFGFVTDVFNSPANDVFVVKTVSGDEIMIPAVTDFIEKFIAGEKVLVLKEERNLYEEDED